ncbi:MAG: hypothetical protein PHC64_03500 [Candidatus Gastranaerophilales bacterium]|nr:hypothetical protein [Candidatus Gastranaerophilales bacterium]
MKKTLIKYFKSLGIEVYTNTKARGHQGFFLKNRIDISKNTKEERVIPTLLHEFSHYIHNKLEPDMVKTGGSLEVLFKLKETGNSKQETEAIQNNRSPIHPFTHSPKEELLLVTHYVDENSLCHKLKLHKEQVKNKIKLLEKEIKKDYPNFMRSKKFKEFDKYIKKSKAKYLLKYDRVKFISPFLRREEIFSITALEKDFPDMPAAFCAYIRLKSAQKKQARISARINRLNKYYSKPTELFARFVEGIYIDEEKIRQLAPNAYKRFFELIEEDYYFELSEVFKLIQNIKLLQVSLNTA